ncbi:hypothetical protein BDY17DRAFT_294310 [Neohortaea acidophila]|uniref:MARVEL domain-containing protein n=1 Tax=Neohortaea acidophila TaxID=245834 RepID=A0A6A6Q0Q0_9PEZI|nr:uncharacterized protein BDY17DRAFT_294310 [Neohortaea acidophila]KAF2485835.1 hypothetical protein BDY17DRAFT_294310 [Neohortaea acidophila]
MEGSRLALIILRVWLILCACVVLGTSVDLANYTTSRDIQEFCKVVENSSNCNLHGLVAAVEFTAFAGAWGLIAALLGLISAFITAIPWVAVAVIDGLACIFYFAGGVRLAVWISDYPCRGTHCTELKADTAFLFLGLLTTLVLIALGFFWQRGSRKF